MAALIIGRSMLPSFFRASRTLAVANFGNLWVDNFGNPAHDPFIMRDLGAYLRELRLQKRKSLKKAAPELKLSVSYLSKLETGKLIPPPETAKKLARYYGVDAESMNALAGRLPDDVVRILQGNPDGAIRLLREKFGGRR